jgi:hypothetical protein
MLAFHAGLDLKPGEWLLRTSDDDMARRERRAKRIQAVKHKARFTTIVT